MEKKVKRVRHGEYKTRLHKAWRSMKERCLYKTSVGYKNYGGRGITVCQEWLKSYIAFRDWSYANGYDPNAAFGECTLDRIDVNGNYEPSNCRWVSMKVQNHNRRSCRKITYNGETHDLTEWGEITGFGDDVISHRLKNGWNIERALTEPLKRSEKETINNMLEFMMDREWFTRDELSIATGIKGVDRYLVKIKEMGYEFDTDWKYKGEPSGCRGRIRLYRLKRSSEDEL